MWQALFLLLPMKHSSYVSWQIWGVFLSSALCGWRKWGTEGECIIQQIFFRPKQPVLKAPLIPLCCSLDRCILSKELAVPRDGGHRGWNIYSPEQAAAFSWHSDQVHLPPLLGKITFWSEKFKVHLLLSFSQNGPRLMACDEYKIEGRFLSLCEE